MTDLSVKQYRSGDFIIATLAYINREGQIRFRATCTWRTPGICIVDTMHHDTREKASEAAQKGIEEVVTGLLDVVTNLRTGKEMEDG